MRRARHAGKATIGRQMRAWRSIVDGATIAFAPTQRRWESKWPNILGPWAKADKSPLSGLTVPIRGKFAKARNAKARGHHPWFGTMRMRRRGLFSARRYLEWFQAPSRRRAGASPDFR